jgi:predicted dehydrogenase
MVGGGIDGFIGAAHRMGAQLDGRIELACGAFSADPAKSRAVGAALGLSPDRAYDDFAQMIERERALPVETRMDFVAIVTPNDVHYAPAMMALQNGFHAVVDKPLCRSLEEALALEEAAQKSGLVVAVTHPYSGYPMVKEARSQIATGQIGAVRKVYVEYRQGWLSKELEALGHKQAAWRTDPSRSGAGGAIADIGTHAAHLAEYITGCRIASVSAMLNTHVAGRRLDDDAAMLLRFDNGASGVLVATQVAAGEENDLSIRVYGEDGGLEWRQMEPNSLTVRSLDGPARIFRTGGDYCSVAARRATRLPSGHPEGYLEAFANLYSAFADAVDDFQKDGTWQPGRYDFPGIADGLRGMQFIDTVVRSSSSAQKWVDFPDIQRDSPAA